MGSGQALMRCSGRGDMCERRGEAAAAAAAAAAIAERAGAGSRQCWWCRYTGDDIGAGGAGGGVAGRWRRR